MKYKYRYNKHAFSKRGQPRSCNNIRVTRYDKCSDMSMINICICTVLCKLHVTLMFVYVTLKHTSYHNSHIIKSFKVWLGMCIFSCKKKRQAMYKEKSSHKFTQAKQTQK